MEINSDSYNMGGAANAMYCLEEFYSHKVNIIMFCMAFLWNEICVRANS